MNQLIQDVNKYCNYIHILNVIDTISVLLQSPITSHVLVLREFDKVKDVEHIYLARYIKADIVFVLMVDIANLFCRYLLTNERTHIMGKH